MRLLREKRGCTQPRPSTHSSYNMKPGQEAVSLVSPRPEQPLGRGSALSRLGAELELRRSALQHAGSFTCCTWDLVPQPGIESRLPVPGTLGNFPGCL